MNKQLRIAIGLVLVALFTGCATKPSNVVYKTILVTPGDDLLVGCKVEPPPDRNAYLNTNDIGREELQTNMNAKQLNNLAICNNRLMHLREWKSHQQSLFDTTTTLTGTK